MVQACWPTVLIGKGLGRLRDLDCRLRREVEIEEDVRSLRCYYLVTARLHRRLGGLHWDHPCRAEAATEAVAVARTLRQQRPRRRAYCSEVGTPYPAWKTPEVG